jgi:hypothetical protein
MRSARLVQLASSIWLLSVFQLLVIPREVSGQVPTQSGRVTGTVRDAQSGLPLERVFVSTEDRLRGVFTDSTGRYTLSDVPLGLGTLRAERIGLATARVGINVIAGSVLVVDITLSETALKLGTLVVTADRSAAPAVSSALQL